MTIEPRQDGQTGRYAFVPQRFRARFLQGKKIVVLTERQRGAAVYKLRDQGGYITYIGMTMDVSGRLGQIHKRYPWFADVTSINLEFYASREEAKERERAQVAKYRPVHNRVPRQ